MSVFDLAYFMDVHQTGSSRKKEDGEEVCIANISPAERQKRLRFGILVFILTLVIFGVLVILHVNPLGRLPLLFLFWASAIGYFQARDKT